MPRCMALPPAQDPGFDPEPAGFRPLSAVNWGTALPAPQPTTAAAASGLSAPALPTPSAAASSYADLSDRYLDRTAPPAAVATVQGTGLSHATQSHTPEQPGAASSATTSPDRRQTAHLAASVAAASGTAAEIRPHGHSAANGNLHGMLPAPEGVAPTASLEGFRRTVWATGHRG